MLQAKIRDEVILLGEMRSRRKKYSLVPVTLI